MNEESKIAGASMRGWLALIVVFSCCLEAILLQKIDVLKDLALMTISWYFGQKSVGSQNSFSSTQQTVTTEKKDV